MIRPDHLEWITRPHERDEPPRHVAELSELAEFAHTSANIWRYVPGAKGRRQQHTFQAETFVVLSGTMSMYVGERPDGGKKQRILRCPTCQVAVFSRYTRVGIRFVRGGTLDDPSSATPDVHIYTRSKLSWVTLPDSVPAFVTYYDKEKHWPAASLDRVKAR